MSFLKTTSQRITLLIITFFILSSCGVIGLSSVTKTDDAKKPSQTFIKRPKVEAQTRKEGEENNELKKGTPEFVPLASSAVLTKKNSPVFLEEGVASWYGPNFHGKKTANGETYDMNEVTAAHRTLAFNSIVRVTNTANGNYVDVRINDRGPYAKERIIDVSKKAAEKLGMIQNGTATIRLELIEGKIPDLNTFCSLCESFAIQIAAFNNIFDANIEKNKVKGAYINESITDGKKLYRVLYGNFDNKKNAEAALQRLRKEGIDGFVRQLDNL